MTLILLLTIGVLTSNSRLYLDWIKLRLLALQQNGKYDYSFVMCTDCLIGMRSLKLTLLMNLKTHRRGRTKKIDTSDNVMFLVVFTLFSGVLWSFWQYSCQFVKTTLMFSSAVLLYYSTSFILLFCFLYIQCSQLSITAKNFF